jgi:iron complex transport system substrate-binding protein
MKVRKFLSGVLVTLLMVGSVSCNASPSADPDPSGDGEEPTSEQVGTTTSYPLTFTDSAGTTVTIAEEPTRIASLAPNVTEMIFAIGAGDKVIADSDYCYYPAEAASLPKIGNSYGAKIETIIELQTQLVFVSGLFGQDSVKALSDVGIVVVNFMFEEVDDVYKAIRSVGQITNHQVQADDLANKLEGDFNALVDSVKDKPKRKVFIDLAQLYSSSKKDFLGNAIQLLNAENIAYENEISSPQLSAETVIQANPDVYIAVFPKEGYTPPAGFETIAAYQNNEVYHFDYDSTDADIISRQGPRFVEGLKLLSGLIHP